MEKLYDQKRTGKIFSIYHMIHIGLIGAICEKGKYASEQTLGKIQNFKTDFPTFPIDFVLQKMTEDILKLNTREKLKKLIYKHQFLINHHQHLQIVYNIYNITIYNLINIGGNKSSTIMTRSSLTKEKNN
ncbi:hypothetical protein GLOIN_2v1789680 [Rhizophagus irregularis DAOM 181602=DAOM 197198]|nr:hypothetical protein GLOIN_2v1789680 [Rhizophagus irregularis DAOM 181602=DAOM 197198]